MTALVRRFGPAVAAYAIGTSILWVLLMVVLPQALMVETSFHYNLPVDEQGGPNDVYTLDNYAALIENDIHHGIFLKTIWSSVLVTVLALVVCYPIAYYLAQVARGRRAGLLVLGLIVPFWVNEIIRTFSWFLILSRKGIVNEALLGLGLIEEPLRLLDGNTGVMIGMVYAYVLFMVFPLYNAIESLDRSQI